MRRSSNRTLSKAFWTAFVALILTHLYQVSFGQSAKEALTTDLEKIIFDSKIPGFSLAMVNEEKVLYQNGFGFANKEKGIQFTENTVINIGSITKTLIAVALMQLVEKGKIGLDDPINRYLPFRVDHPRFPNDQITIRQLATHTSGLTDGKNEMLIERTYLFKGDINFSNEDLPKDYREYFEVYRSNYPISMGEFLERAYSVDGEWYSKQNFGKKKPGTEYRYTNLGATLLAFILEKVSDKPFDKLTESGIINPLKMENTYWHLKDVPEESLAQHYLSNGFAIPPYELITYPDGGLFTSVSDFGKYLSEMIRGLEGEGMILSKASFKEMMSNQLTSEQFPDGKFSSSKGLMWSVNPEGDNITMNGSDPGVLTYTLFTTAGNLGFVIFMNTNLYGDEDHEEDFNKIRNAVFKHFGGISKEG